MGTKWFHWSTASSPDKHDFGHWWGGGGGGTHEWLKTLNIVAILLILPEMTANIIAQCHQRGLAWPCWGIKIYFGEDLAVPWHWDQRWFSVSQEKLFVDGFEAHSGQRTVFQHRMQVMPIERQKNYHNVCLFVSFSAGQTPESSSSSSCPSPAPPSLESMSPGNSSSASTSSSQSHGADWVDMYQFPWGNFPEELI